MCVGLFRRRTGGRRRGVGGRRGRGEEGGREGGRGGRGGGGWWWWWWCGQDVYVRREHCEHRRKPARSMPLPVSATNAARSGA